MKKEKSNRVERNLKFKVGDMLIYYDKFYSDVGAVFDSMIREAVENQILFSADPYINDTGTKEEYVKGLERALKDMCISHHSFSNSNHEIQIGEFKIKNKVVYSHISKLADYAVVSDIDENKMVLKTFLDGEYKRTNSVFASSDHEKSMIKLDEVRKVYSLDEAHDLWIKWVDENFENIKAGKVNIFSL